MRIYTSCVEMYNETVRELWKRGQNCQDKTIQGKTVIGDKYEQKEIIFYNFRVDSFDDLDDMLKLASKTFNKEHITMLTATTWFNDMLNNKGLKEKWWDLYPSTAKYFKEFCEEKPNQASYSYGERASSQIGHVIKRLRDNIYSRGAIITMGREIDAYRIGRRIPCSLNYHFFARPTLQGNKLNLIVSMRSCDIANFFPLDFARAVLFLKHMTDEVNKKEPVSLGYVIMSVNNLHIYKFEVPNEYKW